MQYIFTPLAAIDKMVACITVMTHMKQYQTETWVVQSETKVVNQTCGSSFP